jgi:hypothetical protein
LGHAVFVVAQAGFVVGEEDLADEVSAAAGAGLLEDVLEVFLDGVGGHDARSLTSPRGVIGDRLIDTIVAETVETLTDGLRPTPS